MDTEHSDDQLSPRYAEPPRMPASINGRAGTSLHNSAVEFAAITFWRPATPLFEKEGDIRL